MDKQREQRGPPSDRNGEDVLPGGRERGYLEAALDSVIIIDTAGCVVEFNRSAEQTFGYVRAAVLGRKLDDLIIPLFLRQRHTDALALFAATGEQRLFGQRIEMVAMRADGSEFPVELALSQIEGEPILVCGAVRDLTRQKEAEEGLRRLAEEQVELRQVATLVAKGAGPAEVFSAVAEAVGRLLAAAGVNMVRFEANGTATKIAGWRADPFAALDHGMTASVRAPILLGGRAWGAIVAYSNTVEPLSEDAEKRLAGFTELIATAIANVEARNELLASRVRLVTAGDEARKRIQRDIHDGVQQHFVNSVINLQLAADRMDSNPDGARTAIGTALRSAKGGLQDLRELAAGLHPNILTIGGLAAALEALASRSGLPVTVQAPTGRYAGQLEAAIYFVAAEALANVAKHAEASYAEVHLWEEGEKLVITIRDDGVGGARPGQGTGLRGLDDRVEAHGGRFHIESPAGAGTLVRASLPFSRPDSKAPDDEAP